ncbi:MULTISPECIES: hypothetical protein [Vitreoscilla]|uniref:Uncharacterized protein n=1 Tax=Vitreoscilla stercoraria TaxID=61 RepID=A0ABY4E6S0_VITST|nr:MULTISPECIES: hypothetical protein [Vitreoscilla]AUZ04895.2 hypothetical protein ADP71_12590 [Vitreoscilla sp. C1]UOO91450.1 hypothetical protein LVJ81_07165 [Vitreoscilla stercoraria]
MILAYIGLAIFMIGGIGSLIAAFKVHIGWFLACLLLAPASLVFLILHWQDAKNPFFLQLAGLILLVIGGNFTQTV